MLVAQISPHPRVPPTESAASARKDILHKSPSYCLFDNSQVDLKNLYDIFSKLNTGGFFFLSVMSNMLNLLLK